MGTRTDEKTACATVTMDDLREFKDSLASSVSTEMREMREMIMQLMLGQKGGVPPPSSNEDPLSPDAEDAAAKAVAKAAAKVVKDDLGDEETSTSTKKGDN